MVDPCGNPILKITLKVKEVSLKNLVTYYLTTSRVRLQDWLLKLMGNSEDKQNLAIFSALKRDVLVSLNTAIGL